MPICKIKPPELTELGNGHKVRCWLHEQTGRNAMSDVLISTAGLSKHYQLSSGFFGRRQRVVRAVDGITLDIHERETFALVGESGCGKTTLGRVMLRLRSGRKAPCAIVDRTSTRSATPPCGRCARSCRSFFRIRSPPSIPACASKDDPGRAAPAHSFGTAAEIEARCKELLDMVGLRQHLLNRYPHQFSGGQRQRIGIARALANKPEFVVCDESVSALDVSIQAQVLNLLRDLQERAEADLSVHHP